MRVEESVEINRPSNEVFDYVANPGNLPEWSGLAIEVKDVPEPLREGDTFAAMGKFLGRRFEAPYERVSVEASRRYTDRATGGPVPNQDWIYTFEEMPTGTTRFTRAVEGEPGGFFKLAEPLIERALKRQVRADLETLKGLLEARG
ncbi:MAG: SRPBCC family protein [Actinomycetota bacterium]|nr:SRPBCC family protein [Actinomycetota bacterium]